MLGVEVISNFWILFALFLFWIWGIGTDDMDDLVVMRLKSHLRDLILTSLNTAFTSSDRITSTLFQIYFHFQSNIEEIAYSSLMSILW